MNKGYIVKGTIEIGRAFVEYLNSDHIPDWLPKVSAPILFIHGECDQRIPWYSTHEALKCASRRSKKIIIPGADHSFRSDPRYKPYVFSATLKWFDKHLRSERYIKAKHQYSFPWQSDSHNGATPSSL